MSADTVRAGTDATAAARIATTLSRTHLVNSVGDGAFLVTFALYFTHIVGLSATRFGLGMSLAWAAGFLASMPLGHLALHAVGVRVMSLRRGDGKAVALETDPRLEGGDTLVLSGRPETLAVAEQKLLAG